MLQCCCKCAAAFAASCLGVKTSFSCSQTFSVPTCLISSQTDTSISLWVQQSNQRLATRFLNITVLNQKFMFHLQLALFSLKSSIFFPVFGLKILKSWWDMHTQVIVFTSNRSKKSVMLKPWDIRGTINQGKRLKSEIQRNRDCCSVSRSNLTKILLNDHHGSWRRPERQKGQSRHTCGHQKAKCSDYVNYGDFMVNHEVRKWRYFWDLTSFLRVFFSWSRDNDGWKVE